MDVVHVAASKEDSTILAYLLEERPSLSGIIDNPVIPDMVDIIRNRHGMLNLFITQPLRRAQIIFFFSTRKELLSTAKIQ